MQVVHHNVRYSSRSGAGCCECCLCCCTTCFVCCPCCKPSDDGYDKIPGHDEASGTLGSGPAAAPASAAAVPTVPTAVPIAAAVVATPAAHVVSASAPPPVAAAIVANKPNPMDFAEAGGTDTLAGFLVVRALFFPTLPPLQQGTTVKVSLCSSRFAPIVRFFAPHQFSA